MLVARESFSQTLAKRPVAGQKSGVFVFMNLGTLGNEVEPRQRLSSTRNTRHKTNGLVMLCLSVLDDLSNTFGGLSEIASTRIRTGDLCNLVPLIERLRSLNDGGVRLIAAA